MKPKLWRVALVDASIDVEEFATLELREDM
jgi:hypothetical protein